MIQIFVIFFPWLFILNFVIVELKFFPFSKINENFFPHHHHRRRRRLRMLKISVTLIRMMDRQKWWVWAKKPYQRE